MAILEPVLTPAAGRHIRTMLRAIAPSADRLDSGFRAALKTKPEPLCALLGITPAAASRLRSLSAFLNQVDRNCRRLALLNVPPEEVDSALDAFDEALGPVLAGRFQPAREQLRLATNMAVNGAYHDVREIEAQAFFGLYRAETESAGIDQLAHSFVRVLARCFRARSARAVLYDGAAQGNRPRDVEHGRASEWAYPRAPGVVFEFNFGAPRPRLPRETALLEAAAARCRAAMERARMESEIRRLDAEARRAEDEERRRIGRELHDEAGQSLLYLRLQLEMMERHAAEPLASRLRASREVAERTIAELRRIVTALSPSVLERLGLRAALRHLAARFRTMHRARLRLSIPQRLPSLPRRTEEVIYRVAQESLQNIAKHSRATRVKLSLQTSDERIRLSVVDNGAGFCADSAKNKPMSFGLASMRERAALIGGALAIRSARGKGVTVLCDLPRSSAPVTLNAENSRSLN